MRVPPLTLLLALLLPIGASLAVPRTGDTFPALTSTDLNGRQQRTQDWLRTRSLVVVTTDRDGGPLARAWFQEAEQRAPKGVRMQSIISLQLPFFVSEGRARSEARKRAPPAYWAQTLIDVRGEAAKALQLPDSKEPYVFVVAPDGRVLASVHGRVDAPEGAAIWKALRRPGRSGGPAAGEP